jgi:hypothetical protein
MIAEPNVVRADAPKAIASEEVLSMASMRAPQSQGYCSRSALRGRLPLGVVATLAAAVAAVRVAASHQIRRIAAVQRLTLEFVSMAARAGC